MAYSDKVLDHYENPRNVGSFDKGDPSIGTGMVGAPACGDVMKLQIKVNDQGVIEDARFKTYGCGSAIASSSLLTEWVKGKTLDQAAQIKNTQIAEELALPPVLAKIESYDSRNHMLEATCHHPQFGVLTMPEYPLHGEMPGFNRLFTLSDRSWRYPIEDGNRVVGLSCLANGDVLVLEGTFGSRFWRSHTTLKRVRLANAPANEPLRPESLVTLEPSKGYQIDNFEGIAHHRGARFFLVSDDNDFFLQRTLLLYIELID